MVPITLYAEMTPNPLTMKFVANKYMLLDDRTVQFDSLQEAKGYSPLAEALFQFPFVDAVFISGNFITVTRTDNVDWDFIVMELRDFIREWLVNGKEVLIMMPGEKKAVQNSDSSQPEKAPRKTFAPSDFDEPIIMLLNEYVKPAVENDGGAIDYVGYEDGVVTVEMKGSCSGCPSSTATLKGGIEQLLKSHIVEVKEVVALTA
ncbi:MAG: NifU family protein [Crocinitomicaceae bacterium]|jgi:Fe-S cluster biogenesis protein NfuA|nr:NifU family protein [Crocinitomicaceae bacterium]MBK6951666.1 NifU family protein [Crocinitomicaceae bacterium]MBK9590113.1 NifU family protein [Crocinitomicaceae bacterium]